MPFHELIARMKPHVRMVTAPVVACLAISPIACERGGKDGQEAPAPTPPAVVDADVVQKTVPIYS